MNANASRTSIYAVHSVIRCDCYRIFPWKFSAEYRSCGSTRYYAAGMNESKNDCAFAARSAHRETDFSAWNIISPAERITLNWQVSCSELTVDNVLRILRCTFPESVFKDHAKNRARTPERIGSKLRIKYTSALFIYRSLPSLAAKLAISSVNFRIARCYLPFLLARTVGIQSGQRCARDPPSFKKIKPAKPLVVKK